MTNTFHIVFLFFFIYKEMIVSFMLVLRKCLFTFLSFWKNLILQKKSISTYSLRVHSNIFVGERKKERKKINHLFLFPTILSSLSSVIYKYIVVLLVITHFSSRGDLVLLLLFHRFH